MCNVLSDVWVNRWVLKLLVSSAVEVYPRETMGLLWGVKGYKKLGRKRRRVLLVKAAYPIQTARRAPTSVDWGNKSAKIRLLNTLRSIRVGIIGEFHSHTKVGAVAQPSSEDLRYYLRESLAGREIIGKDWIEMVIRISEYKVDPSQREPVYGNYRYRKAERFNVRLSDKAYDITLSAWLIKPKNDRFIARQGTVWIEWPIA